MAKISLTQGQFAIVDYEDFVWLNQWAWCAVRRRNDTWCAARCVNSRNGGQIQLLMNREILGLKYRDGCRVRYINKDTLDNRRCNLKVIHMKQSKAKNIFGKYLGNSM